MSERSLVNRDKLPTSRQRAASRTRERILDAALRIVKAQGVHAATTRRIAAEAGVAEGSLYKHFPDKAQMMIAVVLEKLPGIRRVFERLDTNSGIGPLEDQLQAAMVDMIVFYTDALPILAGVSADPELLSLSREAFARSGGPQRAHAKLADFFRLEQGEGRIGESIDPQAVAFLLISACTEYVSLARAVGVQPEGLSPEAHAARVLAALRPVLRQPD